MLRSWTTTAVLPSAVVTDAAETIGASCLCLIKAKCLSKRDQVNYSAPRTLVEFVASGLTPTLWMTGSAGPTKAQTLANVSNSRCCGNAQHGLVTTGWIGLASLPDSAIPNIDCHIRATGDGAAIQATRTFTDVPTPQLTMKKAVTLHLQSGVSASWFPLTPIKSVDTPVA